MISEMLIYEMRNNLNAIAMKLIMAVNEI